MDLLANGPMLLGISRGGGIHPRIALEVIQKVILQVLELPQRRIMAIIDINTLCLERDGSLYSPVSFPHSLKKR